MKKIIEKTLDSLRWLVFSEWYNGSDMGDGILVSIISGVIFIFAPIILIVYWVYTLL